MSDQMVRLIVWIVTGIAGVLATILSIVLNDNLSFLVKRIFRIETGPPPPKRTPWIWVVYALALLAFVIGGAVGALDVIPKPQQVSISTPVQLGGTATVSVKTQPGASCELKYELPSHSFSIAKGLGVVTADGNGICAWNWRISTGTTPGIGHLHITIGGKTEVYEIEISP